MPMYNLLEYSRNYSKTTRRFLNYNRNEPNCGANKNINYSIKDYKASITGKLKGNNTEKKLNLLCH